MSKHSRPPSGRDRASKELRNRERSNGHPESVRSNAGDLVGWRAGLLPDPVLDACLLWGIVGVLVLSRWLAFPASIWDMDEANFALGVVNFDPVHNQPHAPFFPLWVALGKVVQWVVPGCGPAAALQLVSATFSVCILWPLWWLWSSVLPRIQALAASMLYLALPGPWLLSGRAYTEPTATALLVAGLTLWLPRDIDQNRMALGGLGLVGALLVRPQWLVVVVPLVIWRVVRCRGAIERAIVVGVPAVIGGAAVAVVAIGSGGLGSLWTAVQQHRKYMAGASEGFDWAYSELSLHAASGGIYAGTLWISLAFLGTGVLLRDRMTRANTVVVVGLVAAPFVLLLLTTQNPTLPRYALPILALTAGAVVAGIAKIVQHPRWTFAVIGLWVLVSVVLTAPVLGRYRREPSPVMAAFSRVEINPNTTIVAVDRRLVAFVTLERALGRLRHEVVWDYQVELEMVSSPFRNDLVALSTDGVPGWVDQPGNVKGLHCDQPLLRCVASPRFLDITVVEGCALVRPENPSVRLEDLRPGAVVPAR